MGLKVWEQSVFRKINLVSIFETQTEIDQSFYQLNFGYVITVVKFEDSCNYFFMRTSS